MPQKSLSARRPTAALAFRGYNVTNLGRTPELLDHPAYGATMRRYLDRGSEICAEIIRLYGPLSRADITRPLLNAIQTIELMSKLLWLVAAALVGSVVYLSALERTRDFAVLKAVGTSSRALFGGLAVQASLVALAAAIVGIGVAFVLVPNFPLPIEMSRGDYLALPVITGEKSEAESFPGAVKTLCIEAMVQDRKSIQAICQVDGVARTHDHENNKKNERKKGEDPKMRRV